MSPLLFHLLAVACWVLVGAIIVLGVLLVGRRYVRERHFRRMDIWKQELERSWAGWLRAELPDVCWRTEKHRRLMLAEKAAAAIEIEGGYCDAGPYCTLPPREVALPCGERGRPCAGPARRLRPTGWRDQAAGSASSDGAPPHTGRI